MGFARSSLAVEVRIVVPPPHNASEAVVSSLVRGVVARPAKNDAIAYGVRATEFDVADVVGLRRLAILVISSPPVAQTRDAGPTTRAMMPLAYEGQALRSWTEFVGPRHYEISICVVHDRKKSRHGICGLCRCL